VPLLSRPVSEERERPPFWDVVVLVLLLPALSWLAALLSVSCQEEAACAVPVTSRALTAALRRICVFIKATLSMARRGGVAGSINPRGTRLPGKIS